MSIPSSVMKAMKAAGCSVDQIIAVVEAHERAAAEKLAEKREQNRIRQQNHRSRNALSRVTERDERDTPSDKEKVAPKEITSPYSPPKGGSYTPAAELEKVLDAERSAAVVEHRKKIGKPLTATAARLLAAKFSKVADPNAAADEMVANGWQGFKPEWLEGRNNCATAAPANHMQQVNETLESIINGHAAHDDNTIDASYERTDRGSSANLVQFDASATRFRSG